MQIPHHQQPNPFQTIEHADLPRDLANEAQAALTAAHGAIYAGALAPAFLHADRATEILRSLMQLADIADRHTTAMQAEQAASTHAHLAQSIQSPSPSPTAGAALPADDTSGPAISAPITPATIQQMQGGGGDPSAPLPYGAPIPGGGMTAHVPSVPVTPPMPPAPIQQQVPYAQRMAQDIPTPPAAGQ